MKILKHPDKEEIIKRLTEGESIRSVADVFKKRYPKKKALQLTTVTLQKFRKDFLNLDGKVLKDIQEARKDVDEQIKKEKYQKQVANSNAYKEKIIEAADQHLDTAKRLIQLDKIIQERMEYWYNLMANGEELPENGDRELREYMEQQVKILQSYKKLIEGAPDKTVEHRVNITVFNEQITMMQDVIRDVIAEIEPEKAAIFLEKINQKMAKALYRPQDNEQITDAEFKLLSE